MNLVMSKRIIILLSCSALLVVGLYHQAMLSIFHAWLNNEHYSHGLLILPVCAALVYLKRKEVRRAEPRVWHIIPLCCGLLLSLLGIVFFMPVVVAFSLLPVLAGFSLLFLGKGAKPLLFPIILLATVIPVPAFGLLTIPLQGISAVSVFVSTEMGWKTGEEVFVWAKSGFQSNEKMMDFSRSSSRLGNHPPFTRLQCATTALAIW
ncbi:exosortase/archaeosortase family protein [Dehalococcoidia bacterium]|nr:exosortase/archaeosortase family protein [Dehalococcoidia bacterium]